MARTAVAILAVFLASVLLPVLTRQPVRGAPQAPKRSEAPSAPEWQVHFVKAELADRFYTTLTTSGGGVPSRRYISPPEAGNHTLAVVELKVKALSGGMANLSARLASHKPGVPEDTKEYLSGRIPKAWSRILAALHKPANVDNVRTQLFVSDMVTLQWDGKSILPTWVQLPGYGVASFQGLTGFDGGAAFDPAQHPVVFYTKKDATAAWFQPAKEVDLKLIYTVPKEIRKATLRFQDLPPIAIMLEEKKAK